MRLGYVILYVPEVDAALGFYQKAFGLERRFLHESGLYGELDTGATVLAFAGEVMAAANDLVIRPHRPDEAPAATEIALVSDDVAGAYQRAVAAGAGPVAVPAEKPWGQTVAYVRDLNGVLIELCSPLG